MTDQHPPHPHEPERPDAADGDDGRNQWDFEAPDPSLSFHGDRPTDPDALADRPTGAAVPPPTAGVAGAAAAGAAPAATPPPPTGTPDAADPNATRVVDAAPPLASPGAAGPPATNRVGTRTAAILVGVAALIGLGIVAALAFTGGDDGDVVATDPTPDPGVTPEPTPEATPDQSTPTPGPTPDPTATPLPLSAATDLAARPAAFGGEVTERWDLDDGRLTSTIEIASDGDDAVDGLYTVVIPTSIATDLATVTFEPEPDEVVIADDPAAAFAVALDPGDPPVTITWAADVDLPAGETPDAALERLLADRAAAEFRFAVDTPDLTITAPDDGSTTIGSSVTLRGQTEADATVTVNRDPVDVDEDNGRFRTDIERTRDRRELTVVATDPYGRSTVVTWTVRFADPAPTPTPRPVVVPTTPPFNPTPVPPTPVPPPTTCPPTRPNC